jgi:hypothetical protein
MIGFAPFETDQPPPPARRVRKKATAVPVALQKECTECNYIVIFFVVGVLLLALGDLRR